MDFLITARFPGLAARAFIVSSFGKTYHVTGWKVGYPHPSSKGWCLIVDAARGG